MAITDRMLIGAIAGNPGAYAAAGEYRFCRSCELIFYTSANKPDPAHDDHDVIALPSLNPDGGGKLVKAFQRFITRWPQQRQEELEKFALKRGWDMAMELKYGGGGLDDQEAAEWQEIVNGRLEQLVRQFRAELEAKTATT